jgi:hypothetical protein
MLESIVAVLIAVESGGDPAAVGDGGRSIGILQMSRVSVRDYNRLTGRSYNWQAAMDPDKARHMAKVILGHYAGPPPLAGARADEKRAYAERCARIWNGGPSMRGTDAYAVKFLREWDRRNGRGK